MPPAMTSAPDRATASALPKASLSSNGVRVRPGRPEAAVEVAGGVVAGQRELLVPSAGVEGQAADHGGSATRGHHGVGERVALRSKSHHLAAITEGLIQLSLVRVPGKSERSVRRLLREKVAGDEQPAIGCPGDGMALRAGIGERRGGATVVAKPRVQAPVAQTVARKREI